MVSKLEDGWSIQRSWRSSLGVFYLLFFRCYGIFLFRCISDVVYINDLIYVEIIVYYILSITVRDLFILFCLIFSFFLIFSISFINVRAFRCLFGSDNGVYYRFKGVRKVGSLHYHCFHFITDSFK